MNTSTPAHNPFGSSADTTTMFGGISPVKATDADFQRASDAASASMLPKAVKAALITTALSSDVAYRDANFIGLGTGYARAEAAAQVVRCRLALDEKRVTSHFDLRTLPIRYHDMFRTVHAFLCGDDAERAWRADPLSCAMGWLVLDPVGFATMIEGAQTASSLYPV